MRKTRKKRDNLVDSARYLEAMNKNSIESYVVSCFEANDFTGISPFAAHLHKLSLLSDFEEKHLGISITNYDIPYLKLDVEFCGEEAGICYGSVSFTVKGSSENRPRIVIGDCIR